MGYLPFSCPYSSAKNRVQSFAASNGKLHTVLLYILKKIDPHFFIMSINVSDT